MSGADARTERQRRRHGRLPLLVRPRPRETHLARFGVFHSAELGFVFGTDFPLALPQADEKALGTLIRGYWTRFAHAGDPNGTGSPTWPKYTAASDQGLKLDLPVATTETARKKAKCDFWDTVPPPT